MTHILPALAAATALLATAALAQPPASPPPAAGDAKRGAQAFMAQGCYECHGTVAQGGQGPTLARLKLPMGAFSQLVRQPAGSMPAFSAKSLPDAELADIYAYLQSIAPPPAKRPAILDD